MITSANYGPDLEAFQVGIEALTTASFAGYSEMQGREAKVRCRAALRRAGYSVDVLIKGGSATLNGLPRPRLYDPTHLDLALALDAIGARDRGAIVVGELGLMGAVRPIRGAILYAKLAKVTGRPLMLPEENASEAACVGDVALLPVRDLQHARWIMDTRARSEPVAPLARCSTVRAEVLPHLRASDEVRAQIRDVAASRRSVLFVGPPGSGKTMAARSIAELRDDLTETEGLEVLGTYSAAGMRLPGLPLRPPFRAPHHTASRAGMVGVLRSNRPGEVALARHGVLLLDELPEFDARTINAIKGALTSDVQVIAAANPCPCGWHGVLRPIGRPCACSDTAIARYQERIARLRFDVTIDMPAVHWTKEG